MKKLISIITLASFILCGFNAWPQEREPVTQGECAELIGERLGYKEDPIAGLKKSGITPLGEWNPEKPLTVGDLEAVLIRVARRDPVVENIEPAKLLDSMGFSPRDVSRAGLKALLESDAFKRAMINLRLLLSGPMLPLPLKHLKAIEIGGGALTSDIAVAPSVVAAAVAAVVPEVEVEPPPPPPPDPPPPPSWEP